MGRFIPDNAFTHKSLQASSRWPQCPQEPVPFTGFHGDSETRFFMDRVASTVFSLSVLSPSVFATFLNFFTLGREHAYD